MIHSILFAGLLLIGVPAHPADCHEDEVAWAVDYRTEGAFEDAHGVTRMCIPTDDLIAEIQSHGIAVGYDRGYDAGYADAAAEAAQALAQQTSRIAEGPGPK